MKRESANCTGRAKDRQSQDRDEKTDCAWTIAFTKGAFGFARQIESQRQTRARFAASSQRQEGSASRRQKLIMDKLNGLAALRTKIASRLAQKSETWIIHSSELRILRSISDRDLRAFAADNGWRVVRRLGGRQIEFYNDASTRA